VSTSPLDLVFSDVWGPAPTSIGRFNYYVSFIDDYPKFTWIYLLGHKSEVFQCFRDFQNSVEHQFNRKIELCKPIEGVNINPSTPFLSALASHILYPVPMLTNRMVRLKESIDTLLKWVLLCLPMRQCHLSF
jgi:hypothetical protein